MGEVEGLSPGEGFRRFRGWRVEGEALLVLEGEEVLLGVDC